MSGGRGGLTPCGIIGRLAHQDVNLPGDAGRAVVYRGSRAACLDARLVLAAKGVAYEMLELDGEWTLLVPPGEAAVAREELERYAAERRVGRTAPIVIEPFDGSGIGAAAYVFVLLFTAYCTGNQSFGGDWLDSGALDTRAGGAGEWWRAITALTLHFDQAHLIGNLLFGAVIGSLAARLFGPGVAWASILAAGALANYLEMLIAPPPHRAAGASTAVFAALGLLTGFSWRLRLSVQERFRYRWAPLFAGLCLLALLGAGSGASAEHVDVLGHALGFTAGTLFGWAFARAGAPRHYRGITPQLAAGALALAAIAVAWICALRHSGAAL